MSLLNHTHDFSSTPSAIRRSLRMFGRSVFDAGNRAAAQKIYQAEPIERRAVTQLKCQRIRIGGRAGRNPGGDGSQGQQGVGAHGQVTGDGSLFVDQVAGRRAARLVQGGHFHVLLE